VFAKVLLHRRHRALQFADVMATPAQLHQEGTLSFVLLVTESIPLSEL
jgi:hypothetical protein|tara:strand:+ start:2900 stop:3043 length:144 start_codon:yes stop_codon:yes gene_type:complete